MISKELIVKCLNENNIKDYKIVFTHKESRELFYILKNLEINRAVNIDSTIIKVYNNDENHTANSTVEVTAADNYRTLSKKIKIAYKAAKNAKNEYYPMVEKEVNLIEEDHLKLDLNKIAFNVAKAVFKADNYENGYINSTEIFVSKYRKEFLNSNGVNHVSYTFKIDIEVIPTFRNDKEEFELFNYYQSGKIDYKGITKKIDEALNMARLRSLAKDIKEVEIDPDTLVLIKNDMQDVILDSLLTDAYYRNVYMKSSHFYKGDKISNTKFDITMKPEIEGCLNSFKFDSDGVVLKEKCIVKDGVLVSNYGNHRYGYYLNEEVTGNVKCALLSAKGYDYKKKKHLIIEFFSAPQLEKNTSYFGGEVRLAQYFDGEKYIPVTGFTINGDLYKALKDIKFSKEQTIYKNYKGPKYFIFKDIKIN